MADGSGPGGRTVRGGGAAGEHTVHEGRWTLEDRFESAWHYLPVEVGPGTAGLRVELEYEQSGGTVLDLGCLGPDGFRGWSGGARRWFAVTGQAATPGYLPGAIEAGEWQVMIGLHRVPADGVRYRVTARATRRGEGLLPPVLAAPPVSRERPPRRELPAGPAGGGSRATCMRTPCTPTAG